MKHRADQRRDVFWEYDWRDPGLLRLESRADHDADQIAPGVRSADEALDAVLAAPEGYSHLGALKDWRRATTDQLATVIGSASLQRLPSRGARRWSEMPRWVLDAYDAGLVKRSQASALPIVLQSLRGPAGDSLADRLDREALRTITSGTLDWRSPAGAGRHDILATELLLRLAEYAPDVVSVLPEAGACHGSIDFLGGNGTLWGDGLISHATGHQVLIELTCTVGDPAKLRSKVDGSIALLCATRAVTVLYVEAGHPQQRASKVWSPMSRIVAEAFADLEPERADLVRGRLGVTRWAWWWPSAHHMTDWALTLGAYCPTAQPGTWEQVHFLDPHVAPDADRFTELRVTQATAKKSNPYWLTADSEMLA